MEALLAIYTQEDDTLEINQQAPGAILSYIPKTHRPADTIAPRTLEGGRNRCELTRQRGTHADVS